MCLARKVRDRELLVPKVVNYSVFSIFGLKSALKGLTETMTITLCFKYCSSHFYATPTTFLQVYLLLSATLLGRQCTDISYSAQFDLETLEDVFHTGVASVVADYKISSDMAGVLLVIARALLHKVKGQHVAGT